MIWLLVVAVVVVLPLAAVLFGADSRDGRDWKPLGGFDSADADAPLQHMVGAGGSVLVRRHGHVTRG
jgi:hypothetical protein